MVTQLSKQVLSAALGALALAGLGIAHSGQGTAEVGVKVRLVTSSGACGLTDSSAGVGVKCLAPAGTLAPAPEAAPPPAGPLVPAPGAVPYQRVGAVQPVRVVSAPTPVHSDGTNVTSWRVVRLDNVEYLELTLAW